MASQQFPESHAAERPAPERTKRPAGRPREFDAETVIAAARGLVEAGGSEALTMRALSQASGATVTSIYRNMGDRSAVFDAVLDSYAATIQPPELPVKPADQILTIFAHIYDTLRTMPWTLEVVSRNQGFGAGAMWYVEHFFIATDALSIDESDSVQIYRQLWAYTLGALMTHAEEDSPAGRSARAVNRLSNIAADHRYPRLLRFLDHSAGLTRGGYLKGLRRHTAVLEQASR